MHASRHVCVYLLLLVIPRLWISDLLKDLLLLYFPHTFNGGLCSVTEPTAGSAAADLEAGEDEEEEEEEFDWQVEQTVYTEHSEEELNQLQKYGFGNLRSGVFTRLQVSQTPTSCLERLVRQTARGSQIFSIFPQLFSIKHCFNP